MLNIEIGKTFLITVDNWFYGPDGKQYRGVFGTVKGVRTAEETLGIRPNGRSTNWYIEIGNIVVAGCQIHYVLRTDTCSFEPVKDWTTDGGTYKEFERPCVIYNGDTDS